MKRVYIQADEPYRLKPEDLANFYVRGNQGQMAPFSAFSTLSWKQAPAQLTRYNGLPSMEILGTPAPGVSSGAAMQAMIERLLKTPPDIAQRAKAFLE